MQIMEKKNCFCMLFVAFLLLKGTCAYATVYNGVCGEHVSWTLDSETKVLTISGTGEMYHDGHFSDALHWHGQNLNTAFQSVVIEPGVTSIGYWAFANATNLTSVTMPEGISVVENNAFYNSGITSIVLPNSVTDVNDGAFDNCKQLVSCDLGRGIKHIGKNCFGNCYALTSLKWSDCLETIGSWAFYANHPTNVTAAGTIPLQDTLVFPATFRSMDAIFDCKTNVKVVVWNARRPEESGLGALHNYNDTFDEIIVGSEVEVIPAGLFRDQTTIDTIILPESIESIGQNAFNGCKKLQYVNIPENVQSIGKAAFYNCAALTSLELPESISEIYGSTFYGCKSLTRIHIPQGVTTIGESAFVNCPALDSIVLPSELTMISGSAFSGIGLQDTLVIPDKVVAISSNAFENWSSLEYLSIGKNVTLIADNAFKGDSAIKKIVVWAAVPPMVSEGTLADIPDSAWLSVLPDSRKLYREHAYWGRFRMADVPDSAMIQRTVTVDAAETTADFTWPTDSAAHSYQIDIYKDGAVFCKLTLGNRGQLLGISFSTPGRKMSNMKSQISNADGSQPYTLSFMVTGLDAASRYNYVLSTLDANGTPLHVYIGDFATLGYQGELQGNGLEVIPTPPIIPSNPEAQTPTAIEEIYTSSHQGGEGGRLILINGQLLIRRDGKTYTVIGQEVR